MPRSDLLEKLFLVLSILRSAQSACCPYFVLAWPFVTWALSSIVIRLGDYASDVYLLLQDFALNPAMAAFLQSPLSILREHLGFLWTLINLRANNAPPHDYARDAFYAGVMSVNSLSR